MHLQNLFSSELADCQPAFYLVGRRIFQPIWDLPANLLRNPTSNPHPNTAYELIFHQKNEYNALPVYALSAVCDVYSVPYTPRAILSVSYMYRMLYV
jgi:hypothetical protein